MADLKSAKLMYLKAGLFVGIALLSGGLLILQSPTWRTGALLGLVVWSACRAYYFAFYVIEHYIDPGYRYAGLGDFILRRRVFGSTTRRKGEQA